MKKIEILSKIMDYGILAAIRGESKKEASKMIAAVAKGGIKVIEVPMTIPDAIDIIKEARKDSNDAIIGAGAVSEVEMARACIQAGAQFIITSKMSPDIIKLCNRYQITIIPTVLGISEIISALEAGADIVQILPDGSFDSDIITSVKKVLPQANIMPMDGINVDHLKEWTAAGASVIGVSSELIRNSKKIDYADVEKIAARFAENLRK